jgi:hypothetical protein
VCDLLGSCIIGHVRKLFLTQVSIGTESHLEGGVNRRSPFFSPANTYPSHEIDTVSWTMSGPSRLCPPDSLGRRNMETRTWAMKLV